MTHLNFRPFWALWCKWITVKPEAEWNSFPFLKIMFSQCGCKYVKSLQAIYFGPAKVLLILWTGKLFCLLPWKGNEIQRRWNGLLIDGQKVCSYTRNWNQPWTGSCSTSNYFYLFTVCVPVIFYDTFWRDGCFFKHLLTETINHNCSGKELLT